MKKTDLILQIANKHPNIAKAEIKKSINSILYVLSSNIASNNGIEVRGFGRFSRRIRKSRLGINPKTAAVVKIKQKFVPFFKAGKQLNQILNETQKT